VTGAGGGRFENANLPNPVRSGNTPAGTESLINARQLGDLLGLSASTVLDWHEAGRIPSFKLGPGPGGPVRFRLSEVIAWLEECRRGPKPLEAVR
jgi:excisionase family DNA binding protein